MNFDIGSKIKSLCLNHSMTQHYLHVQDNVRQEAVERFSDAFGGSNSTVSNAS